MSPECACLCGFLAVAHLILTFLPSLEFLLPSRSTDSIHRSFPSLFTIIPSPSLSTLHSASQLLFELTAVARSLAPTKSFFPLHYVRLHSLLSCVRWASTFSYLGFFVSSLFAGAGLHRGTFHPPLDDDIVLEPRPLFDRFYPYCPWDICAVS